MNFVRRLFRRRESHVRFWGGRLSVGFHALCLGVTVAFLAGSSSAAGLDAVTMFAVVFLLLPLDAWWLIRLVGWIGSGVKDETRGWFFAPGLVVLAISVAATGSLTFVRFSMSRGAFEQQVEAFDRSSAEFLDPSPRVGFFDVQAARREDGEYFFQTQGYDEFLTVHAGFAYLPDGPTPEQEVKYSFRSVGGDWYSWK